MDSANFSFVVSTGMTAEMNFSNSSPSTWQNRDMRAPSRVYSITWITYINLIASVVLLLLGLFGNTVTIILMRKKPFRANAHGIYLTALAVADTASLIVAPIRKRFTLELFGKDIRAYSNLGCQLYAYAYRTTKLCSSTFVVLICFERFMALWFPLKAKILSTRRAGLILVGSIYAAMLTVSILFAMHAGVKYGLCFHDMSSENHLLSEISAGLSWIMNSVIPTVLLLLLTPLTIFKLYHQRCMRNRMGSQEKRKSGSYMNITAMLMSAVVANVFLITSFAFVFQIYRMKGINLARSSEPWAMRFIDILSISEQVNYAINFLLYGIFNSEFRRQFLILFSCLCRGSRFYTEETNETSTRTDTNATRNTQSSQSTGLT